MSELFPYSTLTHPVYPTKENELPSIEFFHYKAGYTKQQTLSLTHILVVTEGSLILSYDHLFNKRIESGKIILLPPGCHFTVQMEEQTSIAVFRQKESLQFWQRMYINKSRGNTSDPFNELNCLSTKKEIITFISLLKQYMQNGLKNEEYLKLKNEELVYLIATYYTQEQQEAFFQPLLSPNSNFHNFVLQNYRSIKTVKEFAIRYNCSVSNFDKKFQQVFGLSAYQWMQQKKVKLLYHEINVTDKPLRQIAKEQKFLSLPQFNDYCKKHFGYPPGKMRKLASVFHLDKGV